MPVICEPSIVVEDIKFEVDKGEEPNPLLKGWGPKMPIIKINDYPLSSGELKSFDLSVRLNSLPEFIIEINDNNYAVRESLKSEIDKSVIFIGFKDWYIKFNGIITETISDAGSSEITLMGILYNEKLYESEQLAFKDKTVQDIIKEICTKTSMGLFTIDNSGLSQSLEFCINGNIRNIDFIKYMVEKYTENIWCIDPHYFVHVADIDGLRKQKVDKISLNQKGESIPEQDLIITTYSLTEATDQEEIIREDEKKLKANFYSINTNFGSAFIGSAKTYFKNLTEITTDATIGLGVENKNCFKDFESQYFPFYKNRINKKIGGTVILVDMKNIIFEITPFSILQLDVYLPKRGDEDMRFDDEHSGKKIVIGYSFKFEQGDKQENEYPAITQSLVLI